MSYIVRIILDYYSSARHYKKYAKVLDSYNNIFNKKYGVMPIYNYRILNNRKNYNYNIFKLNSYRFDFFVKIKADDNGCDYRIVSVLPKGYYLYS